MCATSIHRLNPPALPKLHPDLPSFHPIHSSSSPSSAPWTGLGCSSGSPSLCCWVREGSGLPNSTLAPCTATKHFSPAWPVNRNEPLVDEVKIIFSIGKYEYDIYSYYLYDFPCSSNITFCIMATKKQNMFQVTWRWVFVFFSLQEHCIGYDILKRVSPLEADLLKEPTVLCKVRFR